MTPHVLEVQLNAQMIRSIARKVIAVTGSSKLLRRNLSVISPVNTVDLLIADKGGTSDAFATADAPFSYDNPAAKFAPR